MNIPKMNTKTIVFLYCMICFFQSVFLKIGSLSLNKVIFLLLLTYVVVKKFLSNQKVLFRKYYTYNFLWFWLVYTLLLFIVAMFKGNVAGWTKLLYIVMIFWVSAEAFKRILTDIDDYVLIFKLFQIGILMQGAVGLYEHITGIYHYTVDADFYMTHPYFITVKLPCAMQANPNNFAVLMVVGIFISMACIKMRRYIIQKIFDIFCIIFFFYLMLVSLSRSATLMLALGLVGGFIIEYGHRLNRKKKRMIVFFLSVGIIILFLNINKLLSFLGMYMEFGNSSDNTRIKIYIQGLKDLLQTLGLGTGVFYGALHSMWVEVLIEFGVIVFIGFGLFYVRMIWSFKNTAIKMNKEPSIIALAFCEILIGLVIGSFGPSSTIAMEWVGVIIGVMVSFGYKFNVVFTMDYPLNECVQAVR